MHLTDQSQDGTLAPDLQALLARRTQVDALSAKGREPHEIATELGIPLDVVLKDLESIAATRFARAARPGAEVLVDQLSSLDLLQKEAWLAWERSWKAQVRSTKGRKTLASGEQGHVAVTEADRLGDTKYLTVILNCIDRRCELLGVNGPAVLEVDESGKLAEAIRHMSPEELFATMRDLVCLESRLNGEPLP